MRRYFVLFLVILFVMVGCNEQRSENATIAKYYLIDHGYEVITHKGDSWQEFSRSDLLTLPNEQVWAVQDIEPNEFLNNRIDTVSFTIKNHPLDQQFNQGKTTVTVWLVNGEVIGGWSFPISKKNDVVGAPYSLDGRTAEEIHGDYEMWLVDWQERYGK
ncbi:hypothetical protein [Alkalihalobacterium chitinilyticum]|uniref:DUF4830 domain-containing protein n=1 Tax=Alkalihalobacterium chitinilyticum TaxID=2980103 RepID=A0ABT5VL39_9BACI|nr:hypothetical protein [Alkalihalobacterium chitinilyticum]MDE5416170.1 hypothetical protein [Alkalihalobacterium chitinilyticum]